MSAIIRRALRRNDPEPPMTDATSEHDCLPDYEPPRVEELGTLADLTQGIGMGEEDGFGGFENSTPPT